jgi:hypothetical protein
MLPVQNGRHCSSCNKNVVDFTILSNEEIIQFFATNKDKPICGRFQKNQIDTIRIEIQEDLLYAYISSWKKFLILFVVCFGYQLFSIQFTLAQTENIDSATTYNDTINLVDDSTSIIKTDSIIDSNEHLLINIDSNSIQPIIDINSVEFNFPQISGFTTMEPVCTIIMGDFSTIPKEKETTSSIINNNQHNEINNTITKRNKSPINNLPNNKNQSKDNKQEILLTSNYFYKRRRSKSKNKDD